MRHVGQQAEFFGRGRDDVGLRRHRERIGCAGRRWWPERLGRRRLRLRHHLQRRLRKRRLAGNVANVVDMVDVVGADGFATAHHVFVF
jgi:hypothetical protein